MAALTPVPFPDIVMYDPCGTDQEGVRQPPHFGCFQSINEFAIVPIREGQANPFAGNFNLPAFTTHKIEISCGNVEGSASK